MACIELRHLQELFLAYLALPNHGNQERVFLVEGLSKEAEGLSTEICDALDGIVKQITVSNDNLKISDESYRNVHVNRNIDSRMSGKRVVNSHIIPYELDGFGSQIFMDDANIPSLLSLPILGAYIKIYIMFTHIHLR
jgi:hypothetical protein